MGKYTPDIQLFTYRLIAKTIDFSLVLFTHQYFDQVFWTLLGLVYVLACDGFWKGQSVGKRIVGLKTSFVDRQAGQSKPCPYPKSAIRNLPFALILFLSTLPLFGRLFILLGLVFVAIEIYFMYSDEEGIRIGDIYARTRVSMSDHA